MAEEKVKSNHCTVVDRGYMRHIMCDGICHLTDKKCECECHGLSTV